MGDAEDLLSQALATASAGTESDISRVFEDLTREQIKAFAHKSVIGSMAAAITQGDLDPEAPTDDQVEQIREALEVMWVMAVVVGWHLHDLQARRAAREVPDGASG